MNAFAKFDVLGTACRMIEITKFCVLMPDSLLFSKMLCLCTQFLLSCCQLRYLLHFSKALFASKFVTFCKSGRKANGMSVGEDKIKRLLDKGSAACKNST